MATPKRKRTSMTGNNWMKNLPNGFNWMQMMQPIANPDQEMPENMANFYSTMMQAGLELTELCAQRTRAYMELPQSISACKKPEDLAHVEIEFWDSAYDQYKNFSSHNLPGPLVALGGLIDGQIPNGTDTRATKAAATPASKVQAKRAKGKAPTKRKATRKRAGNARDIGSGIFSFPEHVQGRPGTRGRIH